LCAAVRGLSRPALRDNAGPCASRIEALDPMNEESAAPALPDRLSVDPASPHHDPALLERDIGIRLNGKERHDVEEYCVSEGWVRVPAGRTVDRRGRPLLIKLKGQVEVFYR
jgi:hypothetical protein